MILLIDNYDSFVFNLARYLEELGAATEVVRNDALSVADVEQIAPQAVIISPGPCTPLEAGISVDLIRELGPRIPMLGVCLGHQAIATALGGDVIRAPEPVHGRTTWVTHQQHALFARMANPFRAMRYHSLVICESTLPGKLTAIAHNTEGLIMAVAHQEWPLLGVQFHPESVLSEGGHQLLANFLKFAGISSAEPPVGEYQPPPRGEPDWHATDIDAIPGRPL